MLLTRLLIYTVRADTIHLHQRTNTGVCVCACVCVCVCVCVCEGGGGEDHLPVDTLWSVRGQKSWTEFEPLAW